MMKQVEVKFKTPSGNEFIRRINTSGSTRNAALLLAKEFKFFELKSYSVVKEW